MTKARIDFISKETNGRWSLVLAETGPWSRPYKDKLRGLQSKLYDLIDVTLNGALAEKYTESAGAQVCMRLDAYDLPEQKVAEFFHRFARESLSNNDYARGLDNNPYVSGIDFDLEFFKLDSE